MEIERKWKLNSLPLLPSEYWNSISERIIFQGWVLDGDHELRIRKETIRSQNQSRYSLAIKSSGELAREEFDLEIPKWVFDGLQKEIRHSLVKNRFIINYEGLKLEIDVYSGSLFGLIILECEFKTIEEANSFILPNWIGEAVEVTRESKYKNKVLSQSINKEV